MEEIKTNPNPLGEVFGAGQVVVAPAPINEIETKRLNETVRRNAASGRESKKIGYWSQ